MKFLVLVIGLIFATAAAVRKHVKPVVKSMSAISARQSLLDKLAPKRAESDVTSGVQALIDRVLKRANVAFQFQPVMEIIDYESSDGRLVDVFEIDRNSNNQVVLRGSSGVALSTAFGHYLRYYANCDFHWEVTGGLSFEAFPTSLDQMPIPTQKERVVFLSPWRYYQNTCTASYSFVWKNWQSMEYEIDWMAMNGINLPLAFTGQEIVWQKLWREYGVSDQGLQEYFTGPAFLTWQRMANIRGFAGPLSDSWINQQADLQKQILARYAELGMTPVLPAFNGVVPAEMQTLYPDANITRLTPAWNNFPDEYCCDYIIDATEPLFQEIGKAYLQLQTEIFGEVAMSHIYNADTFNENHPASSDEAYLSANAAAVYNSMVAADPTAVWLMQGWMFVHDPFWTDTTIAYYLSGVPDDGMIVLDLSSEEVPIWSKVSANHKQFIWCMLHNYGGARAIYGNITHLSVDPIDVKNTVPDYFLGTGLTMEAIEQNPVVYEFMNEVGFHTSPPNTHEWIHNYANRRYNLPHYYTTPSKDAMKIFAAWELLLKTQYNGDACTRTNNECRHFSIITKKPTWTTTQATYLPATPMVDIWSLIYDVNLQNNSAYNYDLIDIGRQVMSNLFWDYFTLTSNAYNRNDLTSFEALSKQMLLLINDWDTLLNTHEGYLLGKWISDAREWAADDTEADLFEMNARNQITLWGYNGEIDDYAAKNWGGLVKGYYLNRWKLLLSQTQTAMKNGVAFNTTEYDSEELKIGQTFCTDYATKFNNAPVGSAVEVSKDLMKKYGNDYEAMHGYTVKTNTDTTEDVNLNATPLWTKNIKQLQRLCDNEPNCVGFSSEGILKTATTNTVTKNNVNLYIKSKCLKEKC